MTDLKASSQINPQCVVETLKFEKEKKQLEQHP